MASNLMERLGLLSLSLTGLLLPACGSSSGGGGSITIDAPMKDAVLTLKTDDLATDKEGLQYDVKATAKGLAADTKVLLTIEGEAEASLSTVAMDGSILFHDVTLPPGKHTLQVTAANGKAHSADDFSYTYKGLVIETPTEGTAIGTAMDSDSMTDGIQFVVTATAYAVEPSEDISLLLDNTQVGKAVHADAKGKVVFAGVTLPSGSHTLQVVTNSLESNTVHVSVNEGCANVDFVAPAVPTDGSRLNLGGTGGCPANNGDFTIDVIVSTDAGDGRNADLKINGATVKSTTIKGSLATFPDVILNNRTSSNTLSVTVQGSQGTCKPVPFPADIFVNCDGSDCSIASPDPKAGVDSVGQHVLYLNKSLLSSKGGFDVLVNSDKGVLGKPVQLIIDRDDRDALSSDPKQADANDANSKVTATFSSVALSDGAHTVEARCEDSFGNVRFSGEATWIVDTKPCGVHITDPAANVLVVPADDVNNSADGTQVNVKSTITGNDCSDTRSAVCTPANGIDDKVAFMSFDGNASLTTTPTLNNSTDQTLCVEVRDRADNRAIDSVAVKYRPAAPKVQIESPNNGDSYNALGNNGHQSDSDPSTPTVCNANFDVLCSDVGSAVDLHRDTATGAVIATGSCTAASGLPSGFSGRAHIANVAFLANNATSATIVASQKLTGADHDVSGTASVDLTGWCTVPTIDFYLSCPPAQIALPMGNADVSAGTLTAAYAGNVLYAPASATLTVSGTTSGKIGSDYTSALMTDRYRFAAVNFGHTAETVTTQLSATDAFDNTVQRTCMTALVPELPVLAVTNPANGTVFGPGQGCSSGVPGKFGVPLQATLDQTANRTLTYTVGSGDPVTVPVNTVSTSVCVPVNDGPNSITLRLNTTNGMGYAAVTRSVIVTGVTLSIPPTGSSLSPSDDYCDPGFGAHIVAATDALYDGAMATISNGTYTVHTTVSGGGAIDTCLQLGLGPNTITVSIDGTTASASSTVTVVSSAPSHAIPITTVSLPADNVYRTGKVHLAWAAPNQDFSGQLQTYQLHCSTTAIQGSGTDVNKDAWWNAADTMVLPVGLTPPATSADIEFRIGEPLNCVLRGLDAANQLSPIPDSKLVDYAFRKQAVDTSDPNKMGNSVARVGDVNSDGVDDILIGGAGRAYLYFGRSGGLTGKAAPGSPDVTFVGAAGINFYEFGSRVAGVGDFNRDGRNDFVIGFPSYNGNRGAIYVFYGRTSGDAWPTSVDLSGTCAADVCFVGEEAAEFFSYALSPAGDFNNDGAADIAVSSATRDVGTDTSGGRLYVLLSHAYEGSGTRSSNFWGVQVNVPSGDPVGFYIDGTGTVTADDTVNTSLVGQAIAAVGNVDGTAGSDLLFSAAGRVSPAVSSKLLFLSGHTHNGMAPQLKVLASDQATLKDSGGATPFAFRLAAYRNLSNRSESNIPDVLVGSGSQTFFDIYLGDQDSSSVRYAPDTKIRVNGEAGTQFGSSFASSFNPNLGGSSSGDLDGDGLDELFVGTTRNSPSTDPGASYLFYGDTVATQTTAQAISYTVASRVDPSARSGTLGRVVQYVGDVSGDGAPDLVIADPTASSGAGGFYVLY